ncbi:hypothetical protein ABIA65_006254 [Mycolicibacterium sp. 624]
MMSVAVPWFNGPEHAWGFDMNLQQLCSGQQPTPHAIPEGMGGFWAKPLWGRRIRRCLVPREASQLTEGSVLAA